jgi:hypothetical protein
MGVNPDKVLSDVRPEWAFWFSDSFIARNIYEIAKEIEKLDEEGFKYHVNKNKKDISNWIRYVLEDKWLADRLDHITDKEKYLRTINKRIRHLEKKQIVVNELVYFSKQLQKKIGENLHVFLSLVFILLVLTLSITVYFTYKSSQEIDVLSMELKDFNNKNMLYQDYILKLLYRNTQLLEQQPQGESFVSNITEQIINVTSKIKFYESFAPADYLPQEKIHVYGNSIVLDVKDAQWSKFTSTGSMIPVFDENANAVQVLPKSPDDISIGDIIAFMQDREIIIHRVVDTGTDEQGFYYITKGDNNILADTEKVRFEQIEGKVIAVIY